MKDSKGQGNLKPHLESLFAHLTHGLVERDIEIRLAILAALASEHILLVGPPGTAKSEVARRLVRAIGEGPIFERLLTRFSVPEELFGPLSLKALENDRYERQLEGYLPTARVAFIDEIFKANSAILNSLLTVLNERQYDNGTERIDVPLVALVGASNELPEGEELQALYDRFLVRREVLPTSGEGFVKMLGMADDDVPAADAGVRLDPTLIGEIQKAASKVKLPEGVVSFIGAMRSHLGEEGIYVSDRRWRKAVKLLRVAAYTNGQDEVTIWDCKLLEHCLWSKPEEREAIGRWYDGRIGLDAEETKGSGGFTRLTMGYEAQLKADKGARTQARDETGELLFFDDEGQPRSDLSATTQIHEKNANGELLYFAPSGHADREQGTKYTQDELQSRFPDRNYGRNYLTEKGRRVSIAEYIANPTNHVLTPVRPVMAPQRYSEGHIAGRKAPVLKLLAQVKNHLASLEAELETLKTRIEEHLWLERSFAELALAALTRERDTATELQGRLETVITGFDNLPRETNTVMVATEFAEEEV